MSSKLSVGENNILELAAKRQKIQELRKEELLTSIAIWRSTILSKTKLKIELINEENAYLGKIMSWENQSIILSFDPKNLISTNQVYILKIKADDLEFIASISIKKQVVQKLQSFYITELISPVHPVEQRSFFRLQISLDVEIYVPKPLEPSKSFEQSKYSKQSPNDSDFTIIHTSTLDISAGGIRFMYSDHLETESIIYAKFTLMDSEYHLACKLLIHFENESENCYIYRASFVDINFIEQEKLCCDILLAQRYQLANKHTKNKNFKNS
ncbi:MAG: hypothetical protein ATN31_06420 [Candidatus Epulonipiscioides saccharophilum]|nr:MAG: hypothetical protein ATN31_06420 [Epulopiscium sp. AS2M-Bin001]